MTRGRCRGTARAGKRGFFETGFPSPLQSAAGTVPRRRMARPAAVQYTTGPSRPPRRRRAGLTWCRPCAHSAKHKAHTQSARPEPGPAARQKQSSLPGRAGPDRLANAQGDQRGKLQHEAAAVQNKVDGNEPLEAQSARPAPTHGHRPPRDPGHTTPVGAGQARAAACVLRPWLGQARVRQISVLNIPTALMSSAGNNGQPSQGPPSRGPRRPMSRSEKSERAQPRKPMHASGTA